MPWPALTDFSEAVQNPAVCFRGPELDADHHQGVPADKPLVETVPALTLPGPGAARDADVAVDVGRLHTGLPEPESLALGVHAGDAGLKGPAGADVAVGGHETNIRFPTTLSKCETSAGKGMAGNGGFRANERNGVMVWRTERMLRRVTCRVG